MPFLKQQIEIINDELMKGSLKDGRFQKGRIEAIAIDVTQSVEEGKAINFPAVMDANYEAQIVSVDDTWPLIIYHKVLNKTYAVAASNSNFGDKNNSMVERCDVKMVVYGKHSALRVTADQLEAIIAMGFPTNIPKAKIQDLKLDSMQVSLSSSNMNSVQVFMEEYRGQDFFLGPEDIYFSVRYTIETKFRKGCFTITDCECSAT